MIDPASDKTDGYHLFLEPEGKLREEVTAIIGSLAAQFNGPMFSPHISLLARIPEEEVVVLIEKTKQLASSLSSFEVALGLVGMEQAYFRALYMHVESEEIKNVHQKANELFGMQDEGVYLPHMSLLYGNYSETQKQEVASALEVPSRSSFLVNRLHLYKTDGETSNWVKIAEASF